MIVVHFVPYYWGIEVDAVDHSLVTRSTLHEVLPPFRRSTWAVRIRVSHRHWLHVGRYYHEPEARRWGMDADVDEISTWRGPNVEQDEEEQDAVLAAADQVRPLE